MRIIKNTSTRDGAFIKSVFTKVHAYMRTLENRKAPNWKNLRVKLAGREENYHSGRAYYGGHGYNDWDVFLTLPRCIRKGTHWATGDDKGRANVYRIHELASLVYHELMHTYGYKHAEYNDILPGELAQLYPDNFEVPAEAEKLQCAAAPKWRTKYDSALKRRKAWLSKAKRAETALKKIEKQIKYYERTYDIEGADE